MINSVQAITVNEPAVPAAAPKNSGSSFKDYQEAAIKEADSAKEAPADLQNNTSGKTDSAQTHERFKANINIKSGQDAEQNTASEEINIETKTDFSICCDSPINALLTGIVGILEGFGLLNEEAENSVSPEKIIEMITQAFENAQNTAVTDDAASKAVIPGSQNKFSEMIARMPQDDQTNTLQLVQGELENLVKEYLCSFANVNKKGADEESLPHQGVNLAAGQDVMESSLDTASKLKLQLMLKNAEEHLKLHLNVQVSESKPNENAQKIMDKLLLMVQEAYSQSTNSKGIKHNTDNKDQTAKSDVSSKSETALTAGTVTAPGQEAKEVELIQNAKETPTAKNVQDNMERIIQKMTVSLKEGRQQFEVQLKPEYLGKLSIKLMMDNDGIKAHIKASDASVKGMITEQLPALQEALKEKGLTMTHIEISYERPAFENQQSHHQNWQNNNNQKSTRYAESDFGSITYELMSDASELLANYSSVEFQA